MGEEKRYWSTTTPTDKQIRRHANFEYWKFRCPICDNSCSGRRLGLDTEFNKARANGDRDYPFVNYVLCYSCGWQWWDPEYYIPNPEECTQVTLADFYDHSASPQDLQRDTSTEVIKK